MGPHRPTGQQANRLTGIVDVRDMLCAQALAVVAQALDRLTAGEPMEVLYNAADVHRDLLSWAADRGHVATEWGDGRLRIERRHAG
ncbi:MAG: sulfurtransferase TusA family protein [Candidatus Omnitrophica bacterium]|nr:sulfurtransferase TusA family protein [Candidatus Omnitrophota bacterium]